MHKKDAENTANCCTDSEGTLNVSAKHRLFILRNIATIADILEALYNSPNHGNKTNPMDELIYIHLSKKTNERGYTEAFDRLFSAFPNWDGLADADPENVRNLIESAGLGNQRTKELLANCKKILSLYNSHATSGYSFSTFFIFA